MPWCSANKVPTKKTPAVLGAKPSKAPKKYKKRTPMLLRRGEWWLLGPPNPSLHIINVLPYRWLLSSLILLIILTPHFQSGQIGSSKEFDLLDENYKNNDSYNTRPQVDRLADSLFEPAFSLPTQNTFNSQTSCQALNIVYFFVVYGKEETQRQVCKIYRYVFLVQYAQ